ncbi:hypothetical protein POJ06DRAFT_299667 [Lipomyces tetrasporus]|uniref:Uncharacterized protein n=1 Tax=Lipomyces tetrasporus TaxID=54092 RepID=A0AAD7QUG9_9ASCO|nr:uncharacterized protein POJ06DRAFT_299667 [Lipomyces tetrasporus]KAJ8101690.1 hypothetical protein POJ06DRAFT_299667 [Lipomyces tetrasporus]
MYCPLTLAVLLNLFLLCRADFHVSAVVKGDIASCGREATCQFNYDNYVIACPSNYYGCDCFDGHNRGVEASGDIEDINGSSFFQIGSGLCGMGALNFYKQGDASWQFYVDGGDGSLQGTCYDNTASDYCWDAVGSASVSDRLVCYSYICN